MCRPSWHRALAEAQRHDDLSGPRPGRDQIDLEPGPSAAAPRTGVADLDGPSPTLTLTDTRTLRSGMVVLTYAVGGAPDSAG